MQAGRKPEPLSAKIARGTVRPCRDALRFELTVPGDPPRMPDYLTPAAQIVWHEVLTRVMATGVGESDSSLLGRYCATEALARVAFGMGEPVPATTLTVLRQYEELLGIAGPKSRTGFATAKPSNPFASNGKRPDTSKG